MEPNVVRATQILVRILRSQQERGVERVEVTPEARDNLRAFYRMAKGLPVPMRQPAGPPPPAAQEAPEPSRAPQPAPAAAQGEPAPSRAPNPAAAPEPEPAAPCPPEPARATPAPAPAPAANLPPAPSDGGRPAMDLDALRMRGIEILEPDGATVSEKLAWLRFKAEQAPEARALGTLRETMVFAVGNPEAEIAFVGEAPGHDEELQREPFVGAAGQLLTKIIGAMGIGRGDVYISNICKFRPKVGDGRGQGTGNRKPEAVEMAACVKFVVAELCAIRPKVIVALGATAMEGLLGVQMPVGRARGVRHDFAGIPTLVTYHPSYLLRNQALSERRKVWEDMMVAMEIAGLPVSDKQRGFFLSK